MRWCVRCDVEWETAAGDACWLCGEVTATTGCDKGSRWSGGASWHGKPNP